ncbi:MAG: hypothetical protein HYX69_09425 [Planctomycetia bacterium]|nr:hypothetical protein [Planctomycetia bacterium]
MLRALVVACAVTLSLAGALCSPAHAGSKSKKNSRYCSLWILDVHKNGYTWRAGPFPTQSKANKAASWIRETYRADVSAPRHPCDNNNDNTES